jgi:succinate dehydrogenase / fumarate reductase flavoprotein subunit
MSFKLDSKIPEGPIQEKWEKHKFKLKLVNPANKRKYSVLLLVQDLLVLVRQQL